MRFPITMKPWGMEIEFINTPLYCYKMIVCVHGKWSSKGRFHYHVLKDETFLVKSGKLLLDTLDREYTLIPRQTIRVFPLVRHRFRSISRGCIFYEISTHHEEIDSIRVDN